MPTMPRPRQLARPAFDDVTDGRRRNMSAIRGKDTKPETTLRRMLHAAGYRFRLHANRLPGRPDIVFPSRRKVIEVRGCFFHRHGCANSVLPKTRTEWWAAKLDGNVFRDARNLEALQGAGWQVLVVWECEIRVDAVGAARRAFEFLGSPGRTPGGGPPPG